MRLLVLVFLVVVSGTAHAQYGNPYPMRNTAVDTALQNYVDKSILDLASKRQGSTRAKPAVKHEPLSASDFKPTKHRPAVDAFFAKGKLDFIAMSDLRPIVDNTFVAVESHWRKHNVATALGFLVATSLFIARNTNLEEEAVQELIVNINDKLAVSPAFKKLKPAERQMIYDSLILTGAVLVVMNALGENDEGIKADAMEMADAVLQQFGG